MTLSTSERHFIGLRHTLTNPECALVDLALQDMAFRATERSIPLGNGDALARLEAAFIRYMLDCRGIDTSIAVTGFPALDIDKRLYKDGEMHQRAKNERKVVYALFLHLQAAGFQIVRVYDGGENVVTSDPKEAMEIVFNLDESHVWFRKEGFNEHYIYLIMGNAEDGSEVLADWNYTVADPDGFDAALNAFDAEKVV